MADREKVIEELDKIADEVNPWKESPPLRCDIPYPLLCDAIALLKEQEPIKPTINEYGEAYCVCGENVGIIPNSKSLPKIRSKYCSECGRRMKWDG